MAVFPNNNTERKKPEPPQKHMLYNFTYMKFWKSQTNLIYSDKKQISS